MPRILCTTCLLAALLTLGCDQEAPTPAPGNSPAASVPEGVKPYPLKTCIVSDEPLGSMGDPIVLVHDGQEVKFCCEGCTDTFKKDPAKYLAKLPAAATDDHDHAGHDHAGHDHAH